MRATIHQYTPIHKAPRMRGDNVIRDTMIIALHCRILPEVICFGSRDLWGSAQTIPPHAGALWFVYLPRLSPRMRGALWFVYSEYYPHHRARAEMPSETQH